jgi:glycosyltransferase involved in cell wall biosynthesis
MLTPNPWRTESRVIREANALSSAGYRVEIICEGSGTAQIKEKSGALTFHCLPKPAFARQLRVLASAHRAHFDLLARGLRKDETRRQTIRFLPFYLYKLTFAVLAAPLLLLLQIAFRAAPKLRNRIAVPIMRATGLEATLQMNQFHARAYRLLEELAPHIVHAHDLATLPAALVPARNWKTIYDAHELETQTSTLAREPFRRRWVELYEAILAPECDAVITVSHSIAEWLRDTYNLTEPTVIYNTPETSEPRAIPSATLRKSLNLPASTPLAVYVGLITLNRGIEQSVEMLAHHPELHLALVGPRYAPVADAARAAAARIGAADRLHLVEPVPSADVTTFIADADCSLVTGQNICLSYYLSFPNKLLESVFAGIPIVGARLKEIVRFLSEFPVGVNVDETDPRALAAAVRTVIREREKYTPSPEQLSEIVHRYGWQAQKKKLLKLYASLPPAPKLGH